MRALSPGGPSDTDVRAAGGWFDTHAPALLALATVLLEDRPGAERVVERALVEAGARPPAEDELEERRTLASLVYAGCARLRDGVGMSRHPLDAQGAAQLTYDQRAAVALSLFGKHSYPAAAAVMGLSPEVVAALQRSGLHRLRAHPAG